MAEDREKLSWWNKVLGKLGKYIYWWKAEKVSALMFNICILECIKALIDLNDGDIIKGMKIATEIGTKTGNTTVGGLIEVGETIFSRNIEDFPFMIKIAWYVFLNEEIEDIKYIKETDKEPPKVVWRLKDCMFCKCLEFEKRFKFNKETLKTDETKLTYASLIVFAVQSICNEVLAYVNSPYYTEVLETKCKQNGDPYPEFTGYLYKRNEKK